MAGARRRRASSVPGVAQRLADVLSGKASCIDADIAELARSRELAGLVGPAMLRVPSVGAPDGIGA